jgi:hypothetical protein
MTQRDSLACVHEPLGDPWYFGPERLGLRYLNDEERRIESGFSDLTYQAVFNQIEDAGAEVRTFFSMRLCCLNNYVDQFTLV